MNPSRAIAALSLVGALTLACGGAHSTDLFAADAGGAAASPPSSAPAGDGAAPGSSADAGDDGGAAGAGASNGAGSGSTSGAGGGGTTTLSDTTHLVCGSGTCSLPSQTCCVTGTTSQGSGTTAFTYACVDGTRCPSVSGASEFGALACTETANCAAGLVCCLVQAGGPKVAVSKCDVRCPQGQSLQLCNTTATLTGCPSQAPCSSQANGSLGLPPSFAVCGG